MWKFGHSNLRDRWIPVVLPPPISRLTNSKKHLVCQSLVDCSPRFVALKGGKEPCCFRPEDRTLTTPYSFSSGHVESPLQPCRIAGGIGRSHSLSFDQRPRPETLRTASLVWLASRAERIRTLSPLSVCATTSRQPSTMPNETHSRGHCNSPAVAELSRFNHGR
jgi:hypothetical protein